VNLEGIDHVALTTSDIDATLRWYEEVLGFERRFAGEWDGVPSMIGAGDTLIAFFPARNGEPATAEGGMRHLAFRADRRGFEGAQAELAERGIEFEFADHGPAHSIYFRDPEGYRLEITTYELG
jgi:catechol 2,3-dioxygenase-like lactoylglutathione lyase family enzyme